VAQSLILQGAQVNALIALQMAMSQVTISNGASSVTRSLYSEQVKEFYNKIDAKTFTKIQNALASITDVANLKPSKVACQSCQGELTINVMFDYAGFFGLGS
jgi:hypothetical protein